MEKGELSGILKDVLEDVTPTRIERQSERRVLDKSFDILKDIIKRMKLPIEPMLVGSIAKDTDLRFNKDIDLFLLFDKDIPREELEKFGLDIGREFFAALDTTGEVNYAEHPYTKGKYKGFIIEVVPCYRIKKGQKIISAVDRSPLHTEFVAGKLAKNPGLKGEIRLLKQFMKANGLYGANAAVEGFSGYLCELLVIKYGDFMKVMRTLATWERGRIISLTSTRRKFPGAPLVLIDPVDSNRNVAAAVSMSKLARAVVVAQEFLGDPRKELFYPKRIKKLGKRDFKNILKTRQTELICISFSVPQLLEDTLISQLDKSLKALVNACEAKGFRIIKYGQWTDQGKAVIILEFDVWSLPRVERRIGPTFDSNKTDIEGFLKKNLKIAVSKPYMEEDRWAIDVTRTYREAEGFVKSFMKSPEGFGKNLREVKDIKVYRNAQALKIKDDAFWEYMYRFW